MGRNTHAQHSPCLWKGFKNGYFITLNCKIITGRQSGRSRANDGDFFVSLGLYICFVAIEIFHGVFTGKGFKRPDADRLIHCSSLAFLFTWSRADKATDPRERIILSNDFDRLLKPSMSD